MVADDEHYILNPGDVFWAGVGTIHAFYNDSGTTVRWLETSVAAAARAQLVPLRPGLGLPATEAGRRRMMQREREGVAHP